MRPGATPNATRRSLSAATFAVRYGVARDDSLASRLSVTESLAGIGGILRWADGFLFGDGG